MIKIKVEIVTNIVIKRSDYVEIEYQPDDDNTDLENQITEQKEKLKDYYESQNQEIGKVLYVKNQYSYKNYLSKKEVK